MLQIFIKPDASRQLLMFKRNPSVSGIVTMTQSLHSDAVLDLGSLKNTVYLSECDTFSQLDDEASKASVLIDAHRRSTIPKVIPVAMDKNSKSSFTLVEN